MARLANVSLRAVAACLVASCSYPRLADVGGDAAHDGPSSDVPSSDGPSDAPNPAENAVDLGAPTDVAAAGSFVLLAKSGITNVTGSGSEITGGNLGVSPVGASFITGFALVVTSGSVFSTSPAVVAPGKIFAADYAVPTPANLTSAILGMENAYIDAAGRTDPGFTNLDSGNIGGRTLAPGLYKWGAGVTISTDVTIAGTATDVWIFQISNDLDVSTATQVLLSGGAQAKNIFWAVAGQVTIQANAHVEGVILCRTKISVQTMATLHGRALSQTLITIDDNSITAP